MRFCWSGMDGSPLQGDWGSYKKKGGGVVGHRNVLGKNRKAEVGGAFVSQRLPAAHQKLTAVKRNQSCHHLELGLLASKIVRK